MPTKTTKTTAAPAVEATKPTVNRFSRPTIKAATILKAVKQSRGKATAMSLNVPPVMKTQMHQAGLIEITGKVKKEGRGRPAHMYGITDAGRKIAAMIS